MTKYRIVGGTPDPTGILELPDDAHIIGALYHPVTGELTVVMLQKIQQPPVNKPESEVKVDEKVIHLPANDPSKTRKEFKSGD